MPLDALCLSGIIHELNTALSGARVDKIYQPGRDEVILALRTQSAVSYTHLTLPTICSV